MSKILLLIPCYNEAARLDTARILAFAKEHPDVHLLMLDDGSTDGTLKILNNLAHQSANISVYHSDQNMGKGHIIREAILNFPDIQNYKYIAYFDADLSTPLEFVFRLEDEMEKSPDIVFAMGSREPTTDNNLQVRKHRQWIGRQVAGKINSIIGYPFYDTQCGAKLIRRESAIELFRDPFLSAWLFDMELLLRIKNTDGTDSWTEQVLEIPVDEWNHVDGSKISYGYFPKMLKEMKKISKLYNTSI